MTTKIDASIQYNGIMLLTSYLQRLYVSESIYIKLNGTAETRFEQTKQLLDDTSIIRAMFEQTKQLTPEQQQKLKSISAHTKQLMEGYFKAGSHSLNDKIAIVGSSLYGEQAMNSGIIRLGQLFGQDINKDYTMREKMYEDRTKVIDVIVHTLARKEPLDEQMLTPINKWYEGILKQQQAILEDMRKIEEMIG